MNMIKRLPILIPILILTSININISCGHDNMQSFSCILLLKIDLAFKNSIDRFFTINQLFRL